MPLFSVGEEMLVFGLVGISTLSLETLARRVTFRFVCKYRLGESGLIQNKNPGVNKSELCTTFLDVNKKDVGFSSVLRWSV